MLWDWILAWQGTPVVLLLGQCYLINKCLQHSPSKLCVDTAVNLYNVVFGVTLWINPASPKRCTYRKRLAEMEWPKTVGRQWNSETCSDDRWNTCWRRWLGRYRVKLMSSLRRSDRLRRSSVNGSERYCWPTNECTRGIPTSDQLLARKRWPTSGTLLCVHALIPYVYSQAFQKTLINRKWGRG